MSVHALPLGVCPETVEVLEDLLAEARSGELRGFVLAVQGRGGDVIRVSDFEDGVRLLGMLSIAVDSVTRSMR